MQWDDTENAGFTTGTPWIAVNPSHKEINAQAAFDDDDSVFHHYRRLIELRRAEPAVAHGDFRMLLADHDQVYAFTRRPGTTELLLLASFSGEPVTIEVPDADRWHAAELVLANSPVDSAENFRESTLRSFEASVYRLRQRACVHDERPQYLGVLDNVAGSRMGVGVTRFREGLPRVRPGPRP
jgi:oligo-1,6-glucosidase